MRLVDSSAWIEWVVGGPLSQQIGDLFPNRSQWLVPTIVQYELSKWLSRNKLATSRGRRLIAFSAKCVVVELSTEIALSAARLGREHSLAVADAVIYASARAHGADVLTCDAHFEGLAEVVYLAKQPN